MADHDVAVAFTRRETFRPSVAPAL